MIRALKLVDEDIVRDVKDELYKAGDLVRQEARRRFEPFSPFSAQGFVTRVRPLSGGSLVSIEQNLRKTTAARPQWGALQMTEALIPAREVVMDDVMDELDDLVGKVLRQYGF